ncbi:hypothetical protein O5824_28205, partial [Escherichia coli]|nr:hypothetical protein [Escherichia coli]
IVRADRGSLLLVGQRSSQGWQGDFLCPPQRDW